MELGLGVGWGAGLKEGIIPQVWQELQGLEERLRKGVPRAKGT